MNTIARIILPTLLCILAPISAFAQKSIDDIIQNLLNDKKVQVIYSENRDPNTRRITSSSYLLTSSDKSHRDRLINAIKKEREKSSSFSQMGNEMFSISFTEGGTTTNYTLIVDDDEWMLTTSTAKEKKGGRPVSAVDCATRDIQSTIARETARNARRSAAESRREAERSRREANNARVAAQRAANNARIKAQRAANSARVEAQREAHKARIEAQREAQRRRREA